MKYFKYNAVGMVLTLLPLFYGGVSTLYAKGRISNSNTINLKHNVIMEPKFQGTPVKLAGEFVKAGTKAPEFVLTKSDLSSFVSKDELGKGFLLLNIFPSIDTSVCAASVRHFNQEASSLKDTRVLCISKDLPFAQARFCGAEGLKNVITLSSFRPGCTFGKDFGVQIESEPLTGLFTRAIVIINPQGEIVYSQLVPEITNEPDYAAALEALKAAVK